MIQRPPRSTLTYLLFPYTTLFLARLRADNASTRLTEVGIKHGVIGADRRAWYDRRKVARAEAEIQLGQTLTASEMAKRGWAVRQDGSRRSIFEWARFPKLGPAQLSELVPVPANVARDVWAVKLGSGP